MDFPAYVPAAIREHLTALIEGDTWEPQGWAASLADAEQALSEIEQAIEARIRRDDTGYLPGLRLDKAKALKHRDAIAEHVACLRRLAHDSRMRKAFVWLTREFSDDNQWRGFISAAWMARMDYGRLRDRLKQTAKLDAQIAKTAKDFAKLIRERNELGIDGPDELYSIPELLRQTDNHAMEGHNLRIWRALRGYLLGDPPTTPERVTPIRVERVIVEPGETPGIDPQEEVRNTLRYVWGTAPDFPALLDTVAKARGESKPSESGMLGAAIQSRQRNPKMEYLRAFASRLIHDAHIDLTPPVMQAMAIVANVVID